MSILQFIGFNNTIIPESELESVSELELTSYCQSSDYTKRNSLLYSLLSNYNYYDLKGNKTIAAKLCYLISYYMYYFIPKESAKEMALEYGMKAINLDFNDLYIEWVTEIEQTDMLC